MFFDGGSSRSRGKADSSASSAVSTDVSPSFSQSVRNLDWVVVTHNPDDAPSFSLQNTSEYSSPYNGRRNFAIFAIRTSTLRVLRVICLGVLTLGGKSVFASPKPGNFPEIDALQATIMRELDAKSAAGYHHEVQSTDSVVACDECSGNCSGGCWGGCKGQCGGCTGDCSGSCKGDCSVGCTGGCFGNCKGGCALNQSSIESPPAAVAEAEEALRETLKAHGYPL